MQEKSIESIVGRREERKVHLDSLMPRRVRDILPNGHRHTGVVLKPGEHIEKT